MMDYGLDWAFLFYTFIYGLVVGRLTIWIHGLHNEYREKKFLKHLRIDHPDGSVIALSSVATSDEQALKQIKEQLDRMPNTSRSSREKHGI